MFFLVLLVVSSAAAATSPADEILRADTGNWTVGDCLLAQFAMQFVVTADNNTIPGVEPRDLIFKVPANATVQVDSASCQPTLNYLSLHWVDKSSNETHLARNLTVVFALDNSTLRESYGVSRLYGHFELAHFVQNVTKNNESTPMNITSRLDLDTGEKLEFKVSLNHSYMCSDVGDDWHVPTSLFYTFPDPPPAGTVLPANATRVEAKDVQFDAFRPKDAPKKRFQVHLQLALPLVAT